MAAQDHPENRRKGVLDLLSRKGYKFHEELDLGLLDKQFRTPCPLAETKPPPPRKKKKKQDLDLEDEGFMEDEMMEEKGGSRWAQKTPAQIEAEAEAKERHERELAEWDIDFNLRRKGLDKHENTMYRETFISTTKKIYETEDSRARHQQEMLNMIGIFSPRLNSVRAQSQKRVKLAKKLKLEQIRSLTGAEIQLYRQLTDEGGADAYEKQKLSKALQKEANMHLFEEEKETTTVKRRHAKQRQREAAEMHRERQVAGYKQLAQHGRIDASVSKEVMDQFSKEVTSQFSQPQRSATRRSNTAEGVLSFTQRIDSGQSSVNLEGSKKVGTPGGAKPRGGAAKTEESSQAMIGSEEVELDPDAPTPQELLDVEDVFRAKRKDIRIKSREAKESMLLEIVEADRHLEPAMKAAKGQVPAPAGPHDSKGPSPSGSVAFQQQQLPSLLSHTVSRPGTAREPSQPLSVAGSSSAMPAPDEQRQPVAHLQLPPEIRSVSFHAVDVASNTLVGDPLLSSSNAIRARMPPKATASLDRGLSGRTLDRKVDQLAAAGRRTRYLHPMRDDPHHTDILQEFPAAPTVMRDARERSLLDPSNRPSASLNPSFAAIAGANSMLLQAANTQLTPRITLVKREGDLGARSDHLHVADRHSLQRGTPDLEELLGEEFSKVAGQQKMEMPNFLGEGDLLRMVQGEATAPKDFYNMGAARSEGGRAPRAGGKAPKIRKVALPGTRKEEDLVEAAGDDLSQTAKGIMQEESAGLTRDVVIPPEDLKVMKEERSPGKAPAPLDDRLSRRLEAVWEALGMPMMEKLGMVVKYSELQNAMLLEESISCWEEATRAILDREAIIRRIINTRKSTRKSISVDSEEIGAGGLARELQEQQAREDLVRASEVCNTMIDKLLKAFGDVATLKGMPYAEDLASGVDAAIERVAGMNIKDTGLSGDKSRMNRK